MDPYGVLGLGPGASQAEVKRAYRRLAKALHPDAAGEDALPAFLALQDAYERLTGTKVRTVRAPGGGADPRAAGGAEPFREPWRADPARARAAREQARTRRGWPGGQPGASAGPEAGRSSAGRTPSGRAASDRGSAGAQDRTRGAGGGSAAAGPAAGGRRAGGRRRSTRKATLGSTSYDEARDPADPSWAGASWYGPTTGEYWIVNPREYADPRKHGPGYTSRGRTGAGSPDVTQEGDAAGGPEPDSETTGGGPGSPSPSPAAAAPAAPAGAAFWDRARSEPGDIDAVLGALGGSTPADPIRRLGLVLLAWPPLGIAAASVIGELTGCLAFSTSCDGTDPLLPWLAQAIILGVLLLAPLLARVLVAGTVAALVALIPGTALLTALGGGGSAEGPAILGGWLVVAWLIGVGWGIRRVIASAEP